MAGNRHEHEEYEVQAPDPSRPETLYEHRDVNEWAVGKFGILLVLLCILSVGTLYGVFQYFRTREGGGQPMPALNVDARTLPPLPRLQEAPILDLENMRAAEDEVLNGYAWLDEQAGTVRIPVARAMELLVARPPATRPAGEAPAAPAGVTIPFESGMGAKMQRPGGPLADELGGTAAAEPHAEPAHATEKKQ